MVRGAGVLTTLDQYVRHAELFGTECVYETAEQGGLSDLSYLPAHLGRIDKKWNLTTDQRSRLLDHLIRSGVKQEEIAKRIGVSLSSVEKAATLLRDSERQTRMVKRQKPVKTGGLESQGG